jgi:hypothetical protein
MMLDDLYTPDDVVGLLEGLTDTEDHLAGPSGLPVKLDAQQPLDELMVRIDCSDTCSSGQAVRRAAPQALRCSALQLMQLLPDVDVFHGKLPQAMPLRCSALPLIQLLLVREVWIHPELVGSGFEICPFLELAGWLVRLLRRRKLEPWLVWKAPALLLRAA